MGKTYIFGHKNPDTDSISSSIVMANFEKALGNNEAVACRLGMINKECFKLCWSRSTRAYRRFRRWSRSCYCRYSKSR